MKTGDTTVEIRDPPVDEVTWIRKRLGWLLFWITLPWWLAALGGLWFVATWAHYR